MRSPRTRWRDTGQWSPLVHQRIPVCHRHLPTVLHAGPPMWRPSPIPFPFLRKHEIHASPSQSDRLHDATRYPSTHSAFCLERARHSIHTGWSRWAHYCEIVRHCSSCALWPHAVLRKQFLPRAELFLPSIRSRRPKPSRSPLHRPLIYPPLSQTTIRESSLPHYARTVLYAWIPTSPGEAGNSSTRKTGDGIQFRSCLKLGEQIQEEAKQNSLQKPTSTTDGTGVVSGDDGKAQKTSSPTSQSYVEDFSREAAYALQCIHVLSGNAETAKAVTEKWLVIWYQTMLLPAFLTVTNSWSSFLMCIIWIRTSKSILST